MKQVVIENPILNSPFKEPRRHFRFADEGITNEIIEARRTSSYFIPIPRPKKKSSTQTKFFETGWTADRIEENHFINQAWRKLGMWRAGGYAGVTKTTVRLLEYWTNYYAQSDIVPPHLLVELERAKTYLRDLRVTILHHPIQQA